jgi:hypothetical protein
MSFRIVELSKLSQPSYTNSVGPSFETLQAAQDYRDKELNDRQGQRYGIVESK